MAPCTDQSFQLIPCPSSGKIKWSQPSKQFGSLGPEILCKRDYCFLPTLWSVGINYWKSQFCEAHLRDVWFTGIPVHAPTLRNAFSLKHCQDRWWQHTARCIKTNNLCTSICMQITNEEASNTAILKHLIYSKWQRHRCFHGAGNATEFVCHQCFVEVLNDLLSIFVVLQTFWISPYSLQTLFC